MKRIGYLYEKVIDYDNIIGAMRDYDSTRRPCLRKGVDYRLAWEIRTRMQNDLKNLIGKPRRKTVYSGHKQRIIQVPSYESRLVQIALWRVCGKYIDRRIHSQSFSSRKGYGGVLAAKKCRKFVRLNMTGLARYHMYFDIRRFYDSILQDKVMDNLRRVFKDKKVLNMFEMIIRSSEKGLPIGYQFSHALANLYLTPLYFTIMKIKGISKAYVYMDNWTVLSKFKKPLHKALDTAKSHLNGIGCQIKDDWYIAPSGKRDVKICGISIGRRHTRLYRSNWKNTVRDFRLAIDDNQKKLKSIQSRRGWLRLVNMEYSRIFLNRKGKYLWQ